MRQKLDVSVVMSVYNGAKYLRETIDSVLFQDSVYFEFIILNDGSIDESGDILAEYETRDNRIRIIEQKNRGLTHALILGCEEAKGKYIARIDVGDIMTHKKLRKQKQVLDEYPDCVFVSGHTEFCGPEWEHLWVSHGKPDSKCPVSLIPQNPENGLSGNISCHPSIMFRKSAYESVGGYRSQFYYGQDWDLWYRLAEIGNYFVIREILYKVRIFPESISMTNKHCQDTIAKYSKGAFIARCRKVDEQPWIDKAASIRPDNLTPPTKNNHNSNKEPGLYFIGEALRRSGDHRCRPYFFSAIQQNPLCVRSYIRLIQSWLFSKNK